MKHTPPSLLERAAELYDFGAALRAPAPVPAAAPEPRPSPEPVPVEAKAAPAPVAPAARPRPAPGVAAIDRAALAHAGFIVPEAPGAGLAEEFRLIKHELLADIEKRLDASPTSAAARC